MIAVDTSAVVAILRKEADWRDIEAKLLRAGGGVMSASSALEVQLVVGGDRVSRNWDEVADLLDTYHIAIWPFEERQLSIARDAVLRFGKGRHKASLNFGDCFSYALAKSEGLKLLCKGDDFRHTDIEIA